MVEGVATVMTGNAGDITSVSKDGSSLSPKPSPDDERLDTRVLRLLPAFPAFPTTVGLPGDFLGDFRGDDLRKTG